MTAGAGWGGRTWTEDGAAHMDVRGLAPPQPLLAILGWIDQARDTDEALIVHLDRDPILLYPELLLRGWWAEPLPGAAGGVRLKVARVRRHAQGPSDPPPTLNQDKGDTSGRG